ncbi:MAG: T6SS immunity protein Tli4 family protein, partial [Burkholderiales bacterium]
ISLEFMTGDGRKTGERYVPPSLTDEQAIRLFDTIVNSIRLRPTGPGKGAAVTPPPRLPLGTQVTSRTLCPESGLWQCLNEEANLTPRRRFIPRGAPMPYGLASRPAPGLKGLLGRTEETPVEVTWQLVDYGDKESGV